MTVRNIIVVMDHLEAEAPELKPHLDFIRQNVRYSAPEVIPQRWRELMAVLQVHAPETHPRFKQLIKICNGDPDGPCPA